MSGEERSKMTPNQERMFRHQPMALDDSHGGAPQVGVRGRHLLTVIAVLLLSAIGIFRVFQSGERDVVVLAMVAVIFPLAAALMGAVLFIWRRAWWPRIPFVMLAVAGLFVYGLVADARLSMGRNLSVTGAGPAPAAEDPTPTSANVQTGAREDHTGTYVTVRLAHMQFELPVNWTVLSQDERTTIRAGTIGRMANAGVFEAPGEYTFAANLYGRDRTLALMNVRHYPDMDITQQEVRSLSAAEIALADEGFRHAIQQGFGAEVAILDWHEAERLQINGMTALVYGYDREGTRDSSDVFRTRMVRVLDGPRSFTLTISYARHLEFVLRPIAEFVIRSIQQVPEQPVEQKRGTRLSDIFGDGFATPPVAAPSSPDLQAVMMPGPTRVAEQGPAIEEGSRPRQVLMDTTQ